MAGGALRLGRSALPTMISVFLVTAFCTACYFGYRWLTGSERFAVDSVEIRGAERLSDAHIRSRLGVEEGANIFGLRLSRLESRLEADPWIETAWLQRQLPDRLIVEVREHRPAALVSLDGLYLVDARGKAFKRAAIERGEGRGLPVITGLARDEYLRDPDATSERIRDALAIAENYTTSAQRPALGEIHLDARRGTTLLTYENAIAIRVGHARERALSERLRVFDAAWASLSLDERDSARIVYVDNTTRPERVTVGYAETRAN